MPCNEADAVRSARLEGKKMAIKIKVTTNKNISVVIFVKNMYILESEIIEYERRHFFINSSG
jgi:hypothetical protein